LSGSADRVLVVASRWYASAADWTGLYERGWTRIICSKLALSGGELDPDDPLMRADRVPPGYVWVLADSGSVRLGGNSH
jgi:hypothetical protein